VLALRDLSHAHPGAPRIVFPDFESDAARPVLLHGASGSGKSTLIALAAGLLDVQQGSLRLAGCELAGMPRQARDAWRAATLGVVPQRLHLSPSLSVRDNVALAYVSVGLPLDAARVDELLGALGLAAVAARKPDALSVGQLQRAALARALARRPAVLLVDEPTGNLDDIAASDVMALLVDAARAQGAQLVVATHDRRVTETLPEAAALSL
jgi:putative ABC transport system ATP-binding protein